MTGEGWSEVSEEGKLFLNQLLQIDPKKRLTASEALSASWITKNGPLLNRRLSSISGLAAIHGKAKFRKSKGSENEKMATELALA